MIRVDEEQVDRTDPRILAALRVADDGVDVSADAESGEEAPQMVVVCRGDVDGVDRHACIGAGDRQSAPAAAASRLEDAASGLRGEREEILDLPRLHADEPRSDLRAIGNPVPPALERIDRRYAGGVQEVGGELAQVRLLREMLAPAPAHEAVEELRTCIPAGTVITRLRRVPGRRCPDTRRTATAWCW